MADKHRERGWQVLVSPRLRKNLVVPDSKQARWLSLICGLLGLVLAIFALARPEGDELRTEASIQGRNLIIAIDTSRSMLVADVSPNRLGASKAITYELLERFPNDRLGLIAFAGTAALQAPLTTDHNALRETLDQLTTKNIPTGGSNLADAVNLATRTFKRTGQSTHALIVLTDGELHEGELDDAIFDARQAGVAIVTVGIGTRDGGFVPDEEEADGRFRDNEGNVVLSRLEPAVLRTLAADTGGIFLTGGGAGLGQKIDMVLSRIDAFESEGGIRTTRPPLFHLFLLPAMFFFILAMLIRPFWPRPKATATPALMLCLLALGLPRAEAFDNPFEGWLGTRALENGDPEAALEHFEKAQRNADGQRLARLKYAEGAANYQLKNFDKAAQAFSDVLLEGDDAMRRDAHHHIANSLYHRVLEIPEEERREKIGQSINYLEEAVSHYEQALTLDDEHDPTIENKKVTEDFLKMLKQQQEQQQQQQQQQQQEEEEQQGGGEEGEENEEEGNEQQNGEQSEGSEESENGEEGQQEEGDSSEENGQSGKEEQGEDGEPKPGQEEEGENGEQGGENQQSQEEGEKNENPQTGGSGRPLEARPHEDETAEEFARRILEQSADLQKDPLRSHRRQQRVEKDW